MSEHVGIWEEPVRGGYPDPSMLTLSGLERLRAMIKAQTPLPPVSYLIGMRPVEAGVGTCTFLTPASGWLQIQTAQYTGGVGALVSLYLVVSMYRLKRSEVQVAIAYALIIGGAVGNIIDRLQQGYVIDFIHWFYREWHWPTFNVADAAITVGAVLLVMDVLGLRVLNKRKTDGD